MAVKIGSARMGENGSITGGKPGDQTGNEVSTQNWYNHSKGWRVFRAKESSKRKKIAQCMEKACANNKIGYNQNQRNTLYSAIKDKGFNIDKLTEKVNTDCSALVRVCCCYAGINVGNFNTSTEASYLLNTGAFTELTGNTYTKSSDYLMAGDILVTKTKGHTVVVLTNGKYAKDEPSAPPKFGDRELEDGSHGEDVKTLQTILIQLGYDCGKWGADGDFGDATEIAVRKFQKDHNLTVDGIVGKNTYVALEAAIGSSDAGEVTAEKVKIIGGNCYVRDTYNTSGKILGVAREGETYDCISTSENGWHQIIFNSSQNGWVSGKYSKSI